MVDLRVGKQAQIIEFFYEGGQEYTEELGCEGCPYFDINKWAKEMKKTGINLISCPGEVTMWKIKEKIIYEVSSMNLIS